MHAWINDKGTFREYLVVFLLAHTQFMAVVFAHTQFVAILVHSYPVRLFLFVLHTFLLWSLR
jgi:hypothetical protein